MATQQSEALLPERPLYLWLLAAGPTIWAAHFLASYVTAAVWCAKFSPVNATLGPVRPLIGVYTAVALAAIGGIGWHAVRRHRHGTETVPHDADSPEDRHRFLGFATLLLAAVSFVATVYAAIVALVIRSCH